MSSGAAWGCGMWFWATVLGWFSSPKFFPPESKAKLGLIPDREEWSPVDTAKDSGCFQKHREKMGLFDRGNLSSLCALPVGGEKCLAAVSDCRCAVAISGAKHPTFKQNHLAVQFLCGCWS